jgi:hypothetical protein
MEIATRRFVHRLRKAGHGIQGLRLSNGFPTFGMENLKSAFDERRERIANVSSHRLLASTGLIICPASIPHPAFPRLKSVSVR